MPLLSEPPPLSGAEVTPSAARGPPASPAGVGGGPQVQKTPRAATAMHAPPERQVHSIQPRMFGAADLPVEQAKYQLVVNLETATL